MSKDNKLQLFSPLFLKYQADYEKNPRSRVFAPLAEIYRKLGMTDKAMEILSQGIRFHPMYVMGYLGLAFCYFDLKQYSLAYNTLKPLVDLNRDNLRLQKIFAEICIELGYREEALDTYKYLLFINPRDKDVAFQVTTLESLIEKQYQPTHQPIYIPESEFKNENFIEAPHLFDVDKLENKPLASKADFDDWMTLDLNKEQPAIQMSDPYEFWNLEKGKIPAQEEKSDPIHLDLNFDEINVNQEKIYDEDESGDESDEQYDEESQESENESTPLVTHTLVDLYCGQGHIEKALEVLEKILILNPVDQKTIKKIAEIKALMGVEDEELPLQMPSPPTIPKPEIFYTLPDLVDESETSEEDGRKNLMNLFDQQVRPVEIFEAKVSVKDKKKYLIEEKLTLFLKKIQQRALDYQARI